jgi:hypothetical protein
MTADSLQKQGQGAGRRLFETEEKAAATAPYAIALYQEEGEEGG